MTKFAPAAILAVAALLSGTAAMATTHAARPVAAKTVKTTKVQTTHTAKK